MNSVFSKLFIFEMNLIAKMRKTFFPIQVRLHNGTLEMANSVRFDHPVNYQGSGNLEIAEHVIFGYWLAGSSRCPILLQPRETNSRIKIGHSTSIVNGSELIARSSIEIGANCRIGPRCVFMDSDFHGINPDERGNPGKSAPIKVGNNVWIGSEAMILKGVSVGNDAVIGARSVVTRDVPIGAVVAGNPIAIIGSVYA